jgi:cell division protein FtsL
MATPTYFTQYTALVQKRISRDQEIRRLLAFMGVAVAIATVCLLYVNLQARVTVLSSQVRSLASSRVDKQLRNQNATSEIAWWSAPERVSQRAKSMGLVPITRWEYVYVPGFSPSALSRGGLPAAAPTAPTQAPPAAAAAASLTPQALWSQVIDWLHVNATPAAGKPAAQSGAASDSLTLVQGQRVP